MTLTTLFHGNANVGLYGYTHGDTCILGEELSPDLSAALTRELRSTLLQCTIAGTPMPGVFLSGNERILLAPSIIFDHERRALEAAGLPLTVFPTKHTCLGNNLIATTHGALVNPEFSDEEIRKLSALLGVPVKRIEIAGTNTPGACIVLHGTSGVIHRDAAQHELDMVRATLGLERLERASVNLGSPYLRAGILNSAHGLVVGEQSGGPEVVHLEDSLDYLTDA